MQKKHLHEAKGFFIVNFFQSHRLSFPADAAVRMWLAEGSLLTWEVVTDLVAAVWRRPPKVQFGARIPPRLTFRIDLAFGKHRLLHWPDPFKNAKCLKLDFFCFETWFCSEVKKKNTHRDFQRNKINKHQAG